MGSRLISLREFVNKTNSRCRITLGRSVWSEANKDDFVSFYDSTVEEYAKQPIQQLTLQHMLEAGRDAWFDPTKTLAHAAFTHDQLPKRLARRLMDLSLLPHIVVTNPHINTVYKSYYHAFNILRATDAPKDLKENEAYSALLRRLVDEHSPMLDSLAAGLRECRRKPIVGEQLKLDTFLENMLRSRISRRVLAEQHININNGRPNYIGIICTNLGVADSIDFAAGRVKQVAMETFGVAPDVRISGEIDLTIPYIPAHIDYMLYELLKNSARAVAERPSPNRFNHSLSPSPQATSRQHRLPPIHVRIAGGTDSVAIRISDEGGGIPAADVDKVWQFGWTTTDQTNGSDPSSSSGGAAGMNGTLREGLGADSPSGLFGGVDLTTTGGASVGGVGRYRMAGLGFGLPLSRLYARYFGGNLQLVSIPGYGVDVFLSVKKLEGHWGEEATEEATPMMGTGANQKVILAASGH